MKGVDRWERWFTIPLFVVVAVNLPASANAPKRIAYITNPLFTPNFLFADFITLKLTPSL